MAPHGSTDKSVVFIEPYHPLNTSLNVCSLISTIGETEG